MFSATKDARVLKPAAIPHPTHRSTGSSLSFFSKEGVVTLEPSRQDQWHQAFCALHVATIADETINSARELFNLVSTDRRRLLDVESTSVSAILLSSDSHVIRS
jgi:hypothetical protein